MNDIFWSNSLEQLAWFFSVLSLSFLFKGKLANGITTLIYRIFGRFAHEVERDKFKELLRKPLSLVIFFSAVFIGQKGLSIPTEIVINDHETLPLRQTIRSALQMAGLFSYIWLFLRIADFVGLVLISKAAKTETKLDDQLAPFFRDSLKVFVVIAGVLYIAAAVFHKNVTALIGGLGIGGLAVALAAQETLANLLGSFTIFLDKPFTVGDTIETNGVIGSVERVGFRSTRIRTLDKSYVTIPNKQIVGNILNNITESSHRRSRFFITLTYSTSQKQMEAIMAELRVFLVNHPMTNDEPLVRFFDYADSSLNILVTYLVNTNQYDLFCEVREEINFKIMELVNKHKASFAFPSRSLYLENTVHTQAMQPNNHLSN